MLSEEARSCSGSLSSLRNKRPDHSGRPPCKGVGIGVARRGARLGGEHTLRIPPSCRLHSAAHGSGDCRQRGAAARARNKRACCASSLERASAVARNRTTRASHPTICGPELARGSTALHRRRRVASRALSCSALPWCMARLSPARRGARARNKRACCASSPERARKVAHKRATRASHPRSEAAQYDPSRAKSSSTSISILYMYMCN